jgi:hypothetical protein
VIPPRKKPVQRAFHGMVGMPPDEPTVATAAGIEPTAPIKKRRGRPSKNGSAMTPAERKRRSRCEQNEQRRRDNEMSDQARRAREEAKKNKSGRLHGEFSVGGDQIARIQDRELQKEDSNGARRVRPSGAAPLSNGSSSETEKTFQRRHRIGKKWKWLLAGEDNVLSEVTEEVAHGNFEEWEGFKLSVLTGTVGSVQFPAELDLHPWRMNFLCKLCGERCNWWTDCRQHIQDRHFDLIEESLRYWQPGKGIKRVA